jgi:hypothetical protein
MMRNYFDILKETDITDNVVHSLRLDSPRLSRFSSENFPFRKLYLHVTYYSNEQPVQPILGLGGQHLLLPFGKQDFHLQVLCPQKETHDCQCLRD